MNSIPTPSRVLCIEKHLNKRANFHVYYAIKSTKTHHVEASFVENRSDAIKKMEKFLKMTHNDDFIMLSCVETDKDVRLKI